jgi:DNA repair exonuclease SbcCD ATPase subunit
MPSERETFFIGTCVRVADAAAIVDVRLQRHGSSIRDVSGSSRLLFPPHGTIELTGPSAASLHPGDWVAFHVVSEARQGASVLRVTEHRRLLPLEDLSEFGSGESVRRLLVEDGRADGVAGEVMIRIGEREMVRVRLSQEPDGRLRATGDGDMHRLPVWRFDPKLCLVVQAGTHNVTIGDPQERFTQVGTLDWSRDADFVRRIIRSLIRVEAGEDEALRRFAEALGRFADGLERRASPPKAVDPRVAHEILRLRNLSAMLREEQDLLAAYYEVLRDDPEVKSLLDTQITAVAERTVEEQRQNLVERLTAELEEDLAALRARREADIRKSAEYLGAEMSRDLERKRTASCAELEVALADREREGREALEETLGTKRAELEAAVAGLEEDRTGLFKQVELLGQRERDLSASIEGLSAKEAAVLQSLEDMRTRREADIRKSAEELGARMTADLERRIAVRNAEFEAELAERQRQGRKALDAELGVKRAELEAAVAKLEDRHLVLNNATELLERRERELTASVDGLSFKEAAALDAMELRQSEREAELRKSLEILSAGMMSDLEGRIAARTAELEAELTERERQAGEALEASLGARRAALESEVSTLENQRISLGKEIELLDQRARALSASVDELAARETAVFEDLERRRLQREAEVKQSVEDLSARMMGDVERRAAEKSAELDADLAERKRQGIEALEAALADKRSAVETESSKLEERRVTLNNEIGGLERRRDELAASVEGFTAREASLLQDLENRRVQREADIKKSVEDLSAGMIGDLERRLAARTAEFEAGLADRERQAREALDASLGARRAELRYDVAHLETRHATLSKEVEELQRKERDLAASLEELSSREASAVQTVARLSRRILEDAPTPSRGPASATGS